MRDVTRWLLAGLLLSLSHSPALALPVGPEDDCLGPWVGLGHNTGYATSWTIDVTLTAAPSGGRCGTIEYTTPNCGGTLENCVRIGDKLHTQEHYTHDDGRCAPASRVILRCDGETMHYTALSWEQVDSTLHRPAGYTPRGRSRPSPAPPAIQPTPAPRKPVPKGCGCDGAHDTTTSALVLLIAALWPARRRPGSRREPRRGRPVTDRS